MAHKTSGIYAIHSAVNGRTYVGSAVNIPVRWRQHRHLLRKGTHPNPRLQNAWNKYGDGSFEFLVLEECPIDQLLEREQHHIDIHPDRYNILLVAGSSLGAKRTPEARANMSAAHVGHVHTPESREKMSAALMGHTRNVGRVASPETKAKMSAARMGNKNAVGNTNRRGATHTPEARAKMSAAGKGRIDSDETRAKKSAAAKAHWAREREEKVA